MPQPNNFDPSITPPIAKRRCPVCGELDLLLVIEPTLPSAAMTCAHLNVHRAHILKWH